MFGLRNQTNPGTIKAILSQISTVDPKIWTHVSKSGLGPLMIALEFQKDPEIIKEILNHVSTLENAQEMWTQVEKKERKGWSPLMYALEYQNDPEIFTEILSQIDKLEYRTQKEIWNTLPFPNERESSWWIGSKRRFGDDVYVKLLTRRKLFEQKTLYLTPQEAVVILNSDIDKSAIFTDASQKNKSHLIQQCNYAPIDLSSIIQTLPIELLIENMIANRHTQDLIALAKDVIEKKLPYSDKEYTYTSRTGSKVQF